MAISFRTPPTRSLDALRTASNALRPAAAPTLRTLSRVFPVERSTVEPVPQAFPIYHLGLDDIIDPVRGLRAARQTGWRYLIDDEMSATVLLGKQPDQHRFASFTRGRLPTAISRQLVALNRDPTLQGRDFEPVLVEVPALQITAIWLRDERRPGAGERLLPVVSRQPGVTEGRLITAEEFIAALVKPARIMLASTGAG
jgi:hypothetical protein